MNILNASLLTLALALPLTACGERPQANGASAETTIGQKVREATNQARKEMAEGNISISNDSGAKVEISPTGDLLINGVQVPLDANQRALAMQYRNQVMKVAEAGIEVGVQGANLGVRAAGEAIKGILSGNTDQIEARVNAETAKIEASAKALCEQLPALLAAQQKLAAAIPAYKPYAKMDASDIDKCQKDSITVR